jgi:LacI family transcriptional regulator
LFSEFDAIIKYNLLNFVLNICAADALSGVRKDRMSLTAKELAAKLNISAAAVSMALNGKTGVSAETRRQVLEAARKYGYDLTRIADRQNHGGTIYFLFYKKSGAVVSETPFFSEVSEGAAAGCRKAGCRMKIVYFYEENEKAVEEIEDLRLPDSDCAGIILLGTEMTEDDLKPFSALRKPFVLLDNSFRSLPCNSVTIANVQGADLATSYLILRTGKQPGHLRSSVSINNFEERREGYINAVRRHGYSSSKGVVHMLTPSVDGAYADMLELLESGEQPAACYFADNDYIAIGAVKALKQKGYRVPADVAVAGFDNIPFSGIIDPPLTTVHVPKHYLGEIAVERLVSIMKNPGSYPVRIEVATSLVQRRSV